LAQARGGADQAAKTAKISANALAFIRAQVSSRVPDFPAAMLGRHSCSNGQCIWGGHSFILHPRWLSNGAGMKDDQDERERQTGIGTKDSRQDRLKLALRENLKRRKSQARGRSDPATSSSGHTDAALDDADGKERDR